MKFIFEKNENNFFKKRERYLKQYDEIQYEKLGY